MTQQAVNDCETPNALRQRRASMASTTASLQALQNCSAHDLYGGALPGKQLKLLRGLADKHLHAAHHLTARLPRLLRSSKLR